MCRDLMLPVYFTADRHCSRFAVSPNSFTLIVRWDTRCAASLCLEALNMNLLVRVYLLLPAILCVLVACACV